MTIRIPEYQILDGAFTDELVRTLNLNHINGDPLWGATLVETHPDAVRAVHKEYIKSGADIIITAGYQAHPDNLKRHLGYDENASAKLLQTSLQLALDAVDTHQKVAVSLGSYGATQCDLSEYNGSFVSVFGSPKEAKAMLTDFHMRRLQVYGHEALRRASYLAFETIPCLVEVEAIIAAVDLFFQPNTQAPRTWISVVCKNSLELGGGDLISTVAQVVHRAGHLIGINCTEPQHVAGLLRSIRQHITGIEIVVYPNKGQEWDPVNRQWSCCTGMTDDQYATMAVVEWAIPFSPLIIGGCCQTGPRTISALHRIRSLGLGSE